MCCSQGCCVGGEKEGTKTPTTFTVVGESIGNTCEQGVRPEDKVSMLKAQMVKSKAMKELNQVDLKDSIYLMLS